MTRNHKTYTPQEEELMRMLFEQGNSDEQIASIMHRPVIGISVKRRKLGMLRPDAVDVALKHAHHWKKEEVEFIHNYWKQKSDRWMARKLGVTFMQYKKKRQKLGLYKEWTHQKGRRTGWKFLEEEFLIEHYPTHSARWIGEKLGRGENAIQYKAKRLGLHKAYNPGRKGYQDESNNYYSK